MYNRNKKSHRLSKATIALVVSVIVIVFFIFNLTQEIISRRQISKTIVGLKETLIELEQENVDLGNKIDRWQNSGRLEKEARLKLSLKKPGENVVLITDNQSRPDADVNSEKIENKYRDGFDIDQVPDTTMLNIIKWWQYFFSNKS